MVWGYSAVCGEVGYRDWRLGALRAVKKMSLTPLDSQMGADLIENLITLTPFDPQGYASMPRIARNCTSKADLSLANSLVCAARAFSQNS